MYKVSRINNAMFGLYLGVKQCLVASGMVDLLGLEVHAEKTECLLTEQNAAQTECMSICGRQNHNINIASKSEKCQNSNIWRNTNTLKIACL
jgi:hypothetical protein